MGTVVSCRKLSSFEESRDHVTVYYIIKDEREKG